MHTYTYVCVYVDVYGYTHRDDYRHNRARIKCCFHSGAHAFAPAYRYGYTYTYTYTCTTVYMYVYVYSCTYNVESVILDPSTNKSKKHQHQNANKHNKKHPKAPFFWEPCFAHIAKSHTS